MASAGCPIHAPGAPGLAFETWESNEPNLRCPSLRDSIKELREKEFIFG